MKLPLTGRCSFDSARIAIKREAVRRSKCQLSFVLLCSSIQAIFTKRTISNFRSNSRRGACRAADFFVQMSRSTPALFSESSAEDVQKFPYFSLQFPAGDMQLTWTGRYSLSSTPVATKLGPVRRGECQLSFALFFNSIGAFSAKRTISNFRSNSRRATWKELE